MGTPNISKIANRMFLRWPKTASRAENTNKNRVSKRIHFRGPCWTSFDWNLEKLYDFSNQMPTKESYLIQKNIIRQAIGESIPPLAMMRMINSLIHDWPNND